MVISGDIYAMLLTHAKFSEFITKSFVDASRTAEVIVALSADSKDQGHTMVDRAINEGATAGFPGRL